MATVVVVVGMGGFRDCSLRKVPPGEVATVLEGMIEGGSLEGYVSSTACRLGDADR